MRNLELMLEEYIGNRDTDESNVELTLAMGSNRRKREEASHTSDSGTSFSSSSTNSGVKLVVDNIGNSFTSDGEFDIEEREEGKARSISMEVTIFELEDKLMAMLAL